MTYEPEGFDFYVHWGDDKGNLERGTKRPIAAFNGGVPAFGDVLIDTWDGVVPPYSVGKVIERYYIDDEEAGHWHIVLHPIDLSPDRAKGLGLA
jgi:hypothetical protein